MVKGQDQIFFNLRSKYHELPVVELVHSLARMLKLIFNFRILLHVVCYV